MRKSFLILALAAATLAGCSNKQAAPTTPTTPAATPSNTSPSASTPTPSGQTNNSATANNPSNTAPATPPAANTPSGTTGTAKPIPKPPAGAATPPTITKKQYDQLQFNITFDQVQKAIGLGKLVKQTEHQAMYDYVIKEGGTAELEFWDGSLNSKSVRDASDFVPPAQAKPKAS
jgi:hypothetical protein